MFLLQEISKDFFNCTSIPILVFDKNFNLILNCNYSEESLHILNNERIVSKIKSLEYINDYINIKSHKNLIFTAVTISTMHQIPYTFIFAPLTTNKNSITQGVLYIKNECCINYLKDLLNIIAKDKFFSIHCKYSYSPLILNAIKYIHTNYDEDIDLNYLCNKLNVNKSYFCNLFKKETELTFTNFLNNFRIEKSKELLKNTNYSLLNIALASGFKNQSYFSTTFKKITGKSPIEYRK